MLELYQMPISHYCEKIRWALEYKKLAYNKINLLPGLHVKTATKLTGRSSVPILIHEGKAMNESSQIISYLDKQFKEHPLTPDDNNEKDEALEWEKYADEEVGIHVRRLCYHTLLDHPDIVIPFFTSDGPWYGKLVMNAMYPKLKERMRELMKINEDTTQISEQKVREAIDKVHTRLQEHPFIVGERFTRADLTWAALLAPLVMPEGYGLKWPASVPSPLKDVIQSYGDKLDWVTKRYVEYR